MKSPDGAQTFALVQKGLYKHPFDLIILLSAHVILFPLWLVIWTVIPIAIWLEDRGPVFYKQRRVGKNGRVFIVNKFWTMIPDADLKGPARTVQRDSRFTRVGKALRRTALDELPEL
jgi:lipopolysaccharide/colanic/teichoic acid biosynthesis glycosyltransferase